MVREKPQTEHFSLYEWSSRGRKVPSKYWKRLQILMEQLEVLREYLGGPAIHVNSGWRSKSHNDSVGGVKRSQHLVCRAADIMVDDFYPDEVADAIEYLILVGDMRDGGLGRYNNFTHYDIRKVWLKSPRWGRNGDG